MIVQTQYNKEDEPYIRMIYKIAHGFTENTRCSFEDYVNVGLFALNMAREKFDNKSANFQTLAYTMIKNAILAEWQKTSNELSCSAYHINNTEGAKETVKFQNKSKVSLSQTINNASGSKDLTIESMAADTNDMPSGSYSPEEVAEKNEIKEEITVLLSELDKKDRDIIYKRIFDGETFEHIAEANNTSWRRIHYRYNKIKQKLRTRIIERGLDEYAE